MNILPLLLIGILLGGERFSSLKELIQRLDKNAFIMVNETKLVHNGYFK